MGWLHMGWTGHGLDWPWAELTAAWRDHVLGFPCGGLVM